MNINDDLIKNYIQSQKRQSEIIEDSKKRRLENKYNESQKKQKAIKEESKKNLGNKYHADQLKNNNKVIPSSIKKSESYVQEDSKRIKNDFDIDLSLIKSNGFSFDAASSKLKKGLDNEHYLKRGLNRFQKNDFKRAINDFTRGLRNNPENIDIYLVRANAKMKLERFNKAIEDFNLYLQGNLKNLNPFLDRGDCYLKLGSRELALKDYNKASSLGSEIGLIKKKNLESLLKKNKKSINNISKKINKGTNDPKVYFSRAIAYTNEEACDYALVIDDLNRCIDLDPNYEDAYFERYNAKNILCDRYSKKEIDSDLEKYNSIKFKRMDSEAKEFYIQEREQKFKSKPLKTEILLHLIKNLKGKYCEEQIGIASGYFFRSGKNKFLDKEKFQKAKSKKVTSIDVKDDSEYPYNLKFASQFCIYKGRFCLIDGEHAGRVFIPSRTVNESQLWDYSKAKLKDYNLNNLLVNDFYYDQKEELSEEAYKFGESMGFNREKVKEMHLESRQKRESELREEIKMHYFNEPMKYIDVEQYFYLDEKLESDEWFTPEEQAEFYGLRYEDCDHAHSSWSDG